ncbi:MAG: hypothetical protein R2769_00095 [Saprospiraceae bacterium]
MAPSGTPSKVVGDRDTNPQTSDTKWEETQYDRKDVLEVKEPKEAWVAKTKC